MKYVKITFGILVVSLSMCVASVFATTQGYSPTLKALSGVTQVGTQTKTTNSVQGYYNRSTINACTANNNTVAVRVHSDIGGYSDWIDVTTGATSYWNNDSKTNVARAYNLYIKNSTYSVCKAYHTGTWYLDN